MNYNEEYSHISGHHQDEIIEMLKNKYSDDIFDLIKSYMDTVSGNPQVAISRIISSLNDYIEASVELVFEDHDINDGHHDDNYDECAADDKRFKGKI